MKRDQRKNGFLIIILAVVVVGILILILLPYFTGFSVLDLFQKKESQIREVNGEKFVRGVVLVKFRDDITEETKEKIIRSLNTKSTSEISEIGVKIIQLPKNADEKVFVNKFKQKEEVEFAEVDAVFEPAAIPNDPLYTSTDMPPWHLHKIGAPKAWDTAIGNNVTIAILDTGVYGTHEDLSPNIVAGRNIYDNNTNTTDVHVHGHGTNNAGIAGAKGNNGIGVASVCWNCKIMPIRVTNAQGSATLSAVSSGLSWASNNGARVASISFAMTGYSTLSTAAKSFQEKTKGVVIVAAGNTGTTSTTPDDQYVITISSTDPNDVIASFSTRGPMIDISAPGGNIPTTTRTGGYGLAGGTSSSAPIVSGVAGLIISANQTLNSTQIYNILKQSADDLGTPSNDSLYGWGRVNASRAVALARPGSIVQDTIPPSVTITSPLNNSIISSVVTIIANASDNIGVSKVEFYKDNDVTPFSIDTTSPYTASLDTILLLNGNHVIKAKAYDAAGNNASTSVTINVNNFIDTTPPIANIISPVYNSVIVGTTNIDVNATDNMEISKVEFYKDLETLPFATDNTSPYNTQINTLSLTNGNHTIKIKVHDSYNNNAEKSVNIFVSNVPDSTPPTLLRAGSRRTHGNTDFDITFPFDDSATGIESREGGVKKIVLMFNKHIKATDGIASTNEIIISQGTLGSISIIGNIMEIPITNIPDKSCVTMIVTGISDLFGNPIGAGIPFKVLAGDASSSGVVTSADVAYVKSKTGQDVNATNFRADVISTGSNSGADVDFVRSITGTSFLSC